MISRDVVSPPRPRTMVHPGAFNPVRIQSKHATQGQHYRLTLQPGLSLYDALIKPLAEFGVKSASMTILGGFFDSLQYCMARPDPTSQAVIAYTEPTCTGPAYMVFGNATIGKNQHGKPIVHCHAAIRDTNGQMRGGHIIADASIIGPHPISVLVTALCGFDLRVTFDPETNISLLQPQEENVND